MSTSQPSSLSTSTSAPITKKMTDTDSNPRVKAVIDKLEWMRAQKIWPNGLRYLWTDAHGIVLLVSLYRATLDRTYLDQAEQVVRDVKRVLGRNPGFRIGEEPDRDGQYYHYLAKWMFAMVSLHSVIPGSSYRDEAIAMVKAIHPRFVRRGVGVIWKMKEDLSGPYPGYGLGGLDHYDGYVQYRLLDAGTGVLSREIGDMHDLISRSYSEFECRQDLGLGEILWLGHFFPDEQWSKHTRSVALSTLNKMWVSVGSSKGYFRRDLYSRDTLIVAFANHGACYGIQSVNTWPERVDKMLKFFETYKSGDEYDVNAITHVMHCNALFPGIMLDTAQQLAGTKQQQQQQQQQPQQTTTKATQEEEHK